VNRDETRGEAVKFMPVHLMLDLGSKALLEPGFYVFGDRESFAAVYGSEVSDWATSSIDFRKFYLVTIHQGLCPTGGYGIKVLGVSRLLGKVNITAEFREPRPEDIVTMAMTTPYVSFLVPRSKGERDTPVFSFYSKEGRKLAERKALYVAGSTSQKANSDPDGGGA